MDIVRTELFNTGLGTITIDQLKVYEITMGAGEVGGPHVHPCPVTGYIKRGTAIMQVQGQEDIILSEGQIFFEPQNLTILKFGNHSTTESLVFVAFYLVHGDQKLVEML